MSPYDTPLVNAIGACTGDDFGAIIQACIAALPEEVPAPGHLGNTGIFAGMARRMAFNAARQRGPKGRCRTGVP